MPLWPLMLKIDGIVFRDIQPRNIKAAAEVETLIYYYFKKQRKDSKDLPQCKIFVSKKSWHHSFRI